MPSTMRPLSAALATVLLTGVCFSQAQTNLQTGHETPGFFGLESSALPTFGLSYDLTAIYYTANRETDRNGNSTALQGTVQHASLYPSFTWLSPWTIFGGHYAASIRLSLAANAANPTGLSAGSDGIGIGDTYVQPLALYWRGEKTTVSLRYGMWLDTGQYAFGDQNSLGKGFTSQVVTLGWTHYPNPEHLWNYSVITRYSKNGGVRGADLQPGDDVVLDWSIARHVGSAWNLGVAGYGVFQTTRDRGADSAGGLGLYGNAGLGFAASYDLPDYGGKAFARIYQEFNSFNSTEGTRLAFGMSFLL